VMELITKLFADEAKSRQEIRTDGPVFQALQRVFSNERELEQILQYSKKISPLEINRLTLEIQTGINDLMNECHSSNRFEIAFRLWVLAGTDVWIKQIAPQIRDDFDTSYRDLYEDRMDVMLKVTDNMTTILKDYQSNLVSRIQKGRKINLLGNFTRYVEDQVFHMYEELLEDDSIQYKLLPKQIEELATKDDRLQTSLMDTIRQKAADELFEWIQNKNATLPRFFSDEDGIIVRLLFHGKRKPASIGKTLGISAEQAKKKIETVKSKVLLYLGVDPWL